MSNLKKKLSSRKLWAAVAGVVMGLSMAFGLDENVVTSVAGAVVSLASVITYIVTEGKVDAAAAKNAVESVQEAVAIMGALPKPGVAGFGGERTSSEVSDSLCEQGKGYGACEDADKAVE